MSATDSTTTDQNLMTELNTGFLRDLLVVIDSFADRPTGQDIRHRAESDAGYDNLTHGRLYPNLDKLVDMGLVEKGEIDRRSNYYVISSEGEERLESYREFVEE